MGGSTRIMLATDQSDGITVAEVIAPNHRFFADLECGGDENAHRLLEDFARLDLAPSRPVVLDLRSVDFVNSGGFALLFRWSRESKAAGRRFGLCLSLSTDLRKAIDFNGLGRFIPCFTSLSDAESELSQAPIEPD